MKGTIDGFDVRVTHQGAEGGSTTITVVVDATFVVMGGLLAGLVPYLILVFFFGGLGGGDAKLMGAVGAISASWQCVVATSVVAMAFALVLAIIIMIRQGIIRRTLSRLWGAFLMAGVRVKPNLDHQDSPRIAFALAIAVGAMISGVEWLLGIRLPWTGWV